MATILIVDDRPVNRQYLVMLLGYCGHRTVEAGDGVEALALAKTERLDLVITDIMMPTMDGAELVRAMHADPALAATPVIFYSASYRQKEARAIASACGVSVVLSKPADPEVVLEAVNLALGRPGASAVGPAGAAAPGPDLGLLSDALGQRLVEQQRSASRLAVVIELGLDLTAEHEPSRLVEHFCKGARDIVTARFASVGLLNEDGRTPAHFYQEGMSREHEAWPSVPLPLRGELGRLVAVGKPRRLSGTLKLSDLGLADGQLIPASFLGVAVATPRRSYGWLCFCNKIGAAEFTEEDERLAITLAAQLGIAYENVLLQSNALRDAEALRLQAGALAAAANAIMITDRQGAIVWVNPAFTKLTGYSAAEALGQNPRRLKSGQQTAAFYADLWQTILAGNTWHGEIINRRKDGSLYPEEQTITPVKDPSGEITHFIGIKQDIAERKRAEQANAAERNLLRSLVDNLPDLIFAKDSEGRMVLCNPITTQFLGKSEAQLTGKSVFEINPPELARGYHEADLRVLHNGEAVYNREEQILDHVGILHWHLTTKVPLRDHDGRIIGLLAICRDIDERKRAEECLARLNQQKELILNSAAEGILGLDLQGNHTFINPAAAKLLGYEAEELLGRPSHRTWHHTRPDGSPYPEEECEICAAYRDGAVHRVSAEVFWRKDGTSFPVEYASTPIYENDRLAGAVVIFTDITERRRAEAELADERTLLRTLVDTLPDAIFVKDRASRFTLANAACAAKMSVASAKDLIGKTDADFFSAKQAVDWRAEELRIMEGIPVANEDEVLVLPDGAEQVFHIAKFPLRDAHGNITGLVGSARDITKRKQADAEIRRLNQTLEQRVQDRTAQLEAANQELEAFSYSVSHDLRAPLRGIDGWGQALLQDFGDKLGEAGRQLLDRQRASSQRMGVLIDDLLQLSRLTRQPLTRQTVDLAALVHRVWQELHSAPLTAELVVGEFADCQADRSLLTQVFVNLLGNALKFSGRHAHPRIEVGCQPGPDGERVYFVKDNGAGFDPRYAHKLFSAFQRLHGQQEFPGTGIGLAITQRIIRRHGGRIWAESAVGQGATFFFTVPNNHPPEEIAPKEATP